MVDQGRLAVIDRWLYFCRGLIKQVPLYTQTLHVTLTLQSIVAASSPLPHSTPLHSSLGDVCECLVLCSGLAHTLKLPQHQRMSLGRPSLPPIPSEGGNGTGVAQYHGQQLASYAYVGVEPPRYDQVTHGGAQDPQSSHSGRTVANPPTYNMEEAHGSGLRSASSSDAIGDYFKESQQFASSVEIHTAAMEGVKSSTMKKLVSVRDTRPSC